MKRCLIFIASLAFAVLAITTTATARATERHSASTVGGGSQTPPWATVPAPRLFAFVAIQL